MTGGPVWAFIIGSGLFSVLVTAFGGLRTVVWTDAWQVIVLCIGNSWIKLSSTESDKSSTFCPHL